MHLPSISVLLTSFKDAFIRFPMSMLFAMLTCILSVYMVEYDINEKSPVFKLLTMSIIGVPLMISAKIFSERFNRNGIAKWIAYALGLVVLLLYMYFIAPDFESSKVVKPIRFVSVLIFSHLLVSVAPYLRVGQVEDFWEYNKQIFVNWLFGAAYGLIIFLGIAVAFLAVDNLFGVHIEFDWYVEIFLIIASVFHPVYFLDHFPENFHRIADDGKYSKVILNIVKFILIPLSLLYITILYLFSIKIGVEMALPKGWVASLVIGFSITGMLTYLLNYRLPDVFPKESPLLAWFKKWFFYLMVPLVMLLFVAIIKRVMDYGFTPPRYFVMLTAVWLGCILLYFIISKKDKIKLIPMSLIGFLAVGSLSPIDAFRVSAQSQYNRLMRMFEEKNLVIDEIIHVDTTKLMLSVPQQERAASMVQVLDAMNSLNNLNEHLHDKIHQDSLNSANAGLMMMNKLGLTKAGHVIQPEEFYTYSVNVNDALHVEGYSVLLPLNIFSGEKRKDGFEFSDDQTKILWKKNNQVLATLEFKELMKNLAEKYGNGKYDIPRAELSFTFENEQYRMKLMLNAVSFGLIGTERRVNSIDGYFLYAEK